ncbi:hypothetical protein, partial [Paraburkholderia sp. SIMBA_027]|uniref:hypothetical protein n=1 Tax=Paraburkholderia sp. SIMBA_027 TaxID=3085770 RepID=UPI00397A5A0E
MTALNFNDQNVLQSVAAFVRLGVSDPEGFFILADWGASLVSPTVNEFRSLASSTLKIATALRSACACS